MKRQERSPPDADLVSASHRRRLSFSHSDLNDPKQVKDLFEQCLDQVLGGVHPVSRDTAIRLAAIHCYVQFGQHYKAVEQSIRAYKLLPKEYTHGRSVHSREHDKNIIEQYRNLSFADGQAAKRKYCDICRNLPTYGMIFFEVKEPQGNRLIARLFGVNKDCVMSVDRKTKVVIKLWPLEQLRRWAAGPTTFNIDFGDYQEQYYSVQTTEGEKIKRLIAEFVDVIIWKKKLTDPFGLEGDEGAIMIEDFVLRARSVPLNLEEVVEEEGLLTRPRVLPTALSTPVIPRPRQKTGALSKDDRLHGHMGGTLPIYPKEIARRVSLQPVEEGPPIASQLKRTTEYDQLPVKEAPPMPPTPPLSQQIASSKFDQFPPEPFSPAPFSSPLTQLPPAVSRSLPPTLSTSIQQKCQDISSPAPVSVLTEQEIVYEISMKNGQAHRSFEHFYSQSRNLQGFVNAIDQCAGRMREISGQLAQREQIDNLSLTEEQRQLAIQLGEDSIRHRAVLFLAYTAQVIEWTSSTYQMPPKFGAAQMAIVQATDNLCELAQCYRELCALRADTLPMVPLMHSLCASFADFLAELNLEKCQKRSAFLSSASLIGENAFILLNALNEEEMEVEKDSHFFVALNQAIQKVANGTADLVVQAKCFPASSGNFPSDKLIELATNVAHLTSELIALARVLASIMAHPACQKRIQNAVKRVCAAIGELIEKAKADAFNHFAVTGTTDHFAKMQKSALLTEMALKQLLEQTVA